FVDRAWRFVLRREVDSESRERALAKLGDGTLSRATLLRELFSDEEFARVARFDDGVAFARGARARGGRARELTAPPGTDERAVEMPWCLARAAGRRVLDVGYAFAEPAYLAGLVALDAEVVGVDLAHAEVPGLRSVLGDVRAVPFDDGSFDTVLC